PGTALLASVLLRVADAAVSGVPFAAGLAMRDAVAETCGVDAGLKWPNDLLVRGRKLCGLLAEVCPEASADGKTAVIVGAGVNLRVPAFPEGVDGVSLHELVSKPPGPETLLDVWLRNLDARVSAVEQEGMAALLAGWRRHATGLGGPVRVVTAGSVIAGTAVDVRDDGALLVRTAGGVTPVLAGDVQLVAEPDRSDRMRER
ncbi:MAG: biotin--[acetyl-CoA-carboxylase] ligase, partial [Candidatus Dormibacteria bacterium]